MAHNQQVGICKNAHGCPKVLELYREGLPYTTCSYLSGQRLVCCPLFSSIKPERSNFKAQTKSKIQQNAKISKQVTADRISVASEIIHLTFQTFS